MTVRASHRPPFGTNNLNAFDHTGTADPHHDRQTEGTEGGRRIEKSKKIKNAPETLKLKDSGQITMWKRFLEVFSARMHLEILNLDEYDLISSHFYFFPKILGFKISYPPFVPIPPFFNL